MSLIEIEEGAGAAGTALGPNIALADSRASSDRGNGQLPPEDKPPSDVVSINGAELLDRVYAFVRRFICYPSDHATASHVLWIAHAHLIDAWFTTPRLAILSPEPGSGKSRVLEITALLVPNPLLSASSSAAFILRSVTNQEKRPTILYDEIDAVFGPQARGNEDLRAMINMGYRKGMSVGRCYMEKGKVRTEQLGTYAAVAMSGLGNLPDTIMSRSIIIPMRKRAPDEIVEPFQPRHHEKLGEVLHDDLAAWAASVAASIDSAQPDMPDGIVDRKEDVWRPLLTVAEIAGGKWPDLARLAATDAVQVAKASGQPSLSAQLLSDLRDCFGDSLQLATSDLLNKLLADDEAPWGDLKGRKLDARKLAELLRPYGIRSITIRVADDSTPKGYKREAFYEAWKRYLPQPDATSATSATDGGTPKE